MSDDVQETTTKTRPHEYDNTLKALFGEEANKIVPDLLAGTLVVEECNIELNRSMLKTDLVYHIEYDSTPAILNLELQTSTEQKIEQRLLQYHALLHAQHNKPVMSVIIYPFKTTVPKPPYKVKTPNKLFLILHYKVIKLWELDAHTYVKNRIIYMYTLLPGMKGAKTSLLKQALQEMVQHYSRQQLGHRLIRFHLMMRRATVMSEQEKQEVEEELRMQYGYDYFIDENPYVQERIEKHVQERVAESVAKSKITEKQNATINLASLRFPTLAQQAQEIISAIHNPQQLDDIFKQLVLAPDEQAARLLLQPSQP